MNIFTRIIKVEYEILKDCAELYIKYRPPNTFATHIKPIRINKIRNVTPI